MEQRYDIAIIGTGPAGVSAAITATARNKRVLLLGSASTSDKVSKAHQIRNYPGLPEISGEELALMFSCFEGWQVKFYADDPNSQPLRTNDFLMQVQLSQKDLVDELIELINMMTTGGKFEREKDKENFEKLFRKNVFEKFRLYNNSRPRGYGKLAGMEIIKKLMLIEGTEQCRHMVQAVLR